MTVAEALAVLAAGFAAGAINAVVGSGTLVTFPVLLATGLPPVTASVSNTLGLVPGNVSGACPLSGAGECAWCCGCCRPRRSAR